MKNLKIKTRYYLCFFNIFKYPTWKGWIPKSYILSIKVKQSRNRPAVAQRVPGDLGSQISWHSAHEGGDVVSLTHRLSLPQGNILNITFEIKQLTKIFFHPRQPISTAIFLTSTTFLLAASTPSISFWLAHFGLVFFNQYSFYIRP